MTEATLEDLKGHIFLADQVEWKIIWGGSCVLHVGCLVFRCVVNGRYSVAWFTKPIEQEGLNNQRQVTSEARNTTMLDFLKNGALQGLQQGVAQATVALGMVAVGFTNKSQSIYRSVRVGLVGLVRRMYWVVTKRAAE